jgi:crotonobetainyl-CoA:carnitine CoA-transferase CaiB-like acyl-CoA transferase
MAEKSAEPGIFRAIDWLRDIQVLEVTTGVAAPLVGRVLAELGAQVTKLESRSKLDVNRMRIARPTDPEGYPAHEAFQLLHESNADKKSITLNLKSPEGKEMFLDLLRNTDVLIQNFAPGWLDRIGFTFEQLLQECPQLIVLSATGYGHVGPLRTQRSYAPVMTALAGVEGLIGYADGEVMGCSALALADLNCSFHGVFLVMAALLGRKASGRGQHIDLSQTEAAASLIGEAFVEQQLGTNSPGPRGNFGPDAEQWAVLAADGEDSWVAASAPAGQPSPAAAARAGRPGREELLERLRARGVECAPVLSPSEVAADPRFVDRGYLQSVQHPLEMIGELTITSVPWHLDGFVPVIRQPAPLLGHDNKEFFGQRMGPDTYAELEQRGVFN